MDKRRRRFVMHDVYFLDDPLGVAIVERFGAAGVALWMGFIAACKKNHIEGRMSYSDPAEGLAVLGLPGLPLVDSTGEPFTLDDFWSLLADHKVSRRSRSGRRLHVISSRWTEWQVNPRRPRPGKETGRSEEESTDTLSDDYWQETGLETDTDTDTDTSLSQPARDSDEREFFGKLWSLFATHDAEVYEAGGGVIQSRGFFASAAENRRLAHEDAARALRVEHPDWTLEQVRDEILSSEKQAPAGRSHLSVARPPCEVCGGKGVFWPDDEPAPLECECKARRSA